MPDDDSELLAVRLHLDPVQKRGLSGAEIAGQYGHRSRFQGLL
jgi:hypothetical protein